MQAPLDESAAEVDEPVEVIQLVTNRASAPSLGDFLAELHNSDVLSDITICSEDGVAIKCHKLVLIRWSAPFRRMLCGDMREAREASITLHGVDGEVLAAFLRFLYTCHCSISPEKLVGLCAMADQYDVTLLQQLCMDAIRMHASNHRCCCLFYKAAKEIQQPEIQQLAWEQLASNLHGLVRQHDVFVQLEFEDVLRLFSRQAAQGQQQADSSAAADAAPAGTAAPSSSAAPAAATQGLTAAQASSRLPAPSVQQLQGLLSGRGELDPLQMRTATAAMHRARLADRLLQLRDDEPRPNPTDSDHIQQQQQGDQWQDMTRQDIAAAYHQGGRAAAVPSQQQPRRPEYALFLACMAWLHHKPERQQYKQQLYECFDLNGMSEAELAQMRRNPYVQGDPELKEMLLDAFESRCLSHATQPVYHMAPLPSSMWQRW